MELEEDLVYDFNLTESTIPDYRCCSYVLDWLKENMESLTNDKETPLFSKVNFGYNEDTIKGFGKKPVCDVYIDNLDYSSDLSSNVPNKVHSFIIVYLKGNMNNTYEKACEVTDYLIQAFNVNPNFRELIVTETVDNETVTHNIVRETFIRDVSLEIIPNNKAYGVLCAFSLEHELY